jgi:8-oxo-dGDP phosphatase
LLLAQPTAGIMDAAHHIYAGEDAVEVGAPADDFESTAIQWIPLTDVPSLIAKHDIVSASTMAALLLLVADRQASAHAPADRGPASET